MEVHVKRIETNSNSSGVLRITLGIEVDVDDHEAFAAALRSVADFLRERLSDEEFREFSHELMRQFEALRSEPN